MKFKRITYNLRRKVYRKIIPNLRRPLANLCMPPAFLILGAQKSGTTSLFYYLMQHPDIVPPVVPGELHYFDLRYALGPQWYLSNFPLSRKGKITGEKSPYYLYHPLVPERSFAFDSSIRLIILLRDPAKRAYSHFNMLVRHGVEQRKLQVAIKEEMDRVESDHDRLARGEIDFSVAHQRYSYLARSRYVDQLDRWTKFFPRKQIYLETAERFSREPQMVCSEIFSFLNLPSAAISTRKRYNAYAYNSLSETDQKWLAQFFRQSNSRLADSYGVNINDWV